MAEERKRKRAGRTGFEGQLHDVTSGKERLTYLGKEQRKSMTEDEIDESDHEGSNVASPGVSDIYSRLDKTADRVSVPQGKYYSHIVDRIIEARANIFRKKRSQPGLQLH